MMMMMMIGCRSRWYTVSVHISPFCFSLPSYGGRVLQLIIRSRWKSEERQAYDRVTMLNKTFARSQDSPCGALVGADYKVIDCYVDWEKEVGGSFFDYCTYTCVYVVIFWVRFFTRPSHFENGWGEPKSCSGGELWGSTVKIKESWVVRMRVSTVSSLYARYCVVNRRIFIKTGFFLFFFFFGDDPLMTVLD